MENLCVEGSMRNGKESGRMEILEVEIRAWMALPGGGVAP
jgi:hypothetical protein